MVSALTERPADMIVVFATPTIYTSLLHPYNLLLMLLTANNRPAVCIIIID